MWGRLSCLVIALWALFSADPAAARKVALIIGNSDYGQATSLANPANDAALVADAARSAGFDEVIVARDLNLASFTTTLRDFRDKADGAEVAMIYYAGHGIEGEGKNWLLPVDTILNKARDLPYEAVNLERVMETLDGAQVRMVVLDACRNNPFASTWKSGTRAVQRGLAGIEVDDVIVIYAAAPGQTASDGGSGAKNSPFATALANRLPQVDLPLQLLGGSVRDDVLAATGGEQRPFVSASVTGTPIYLRPELRSGPGLGEAAPAQAAAGPAVLVSGSVLVSQITIETIKLSGFFGLPDNLFIEFADGTRLPPETGASYRVKKGDIWQPEAQVTLAAGTSFRVMEFDDIGGHDLLGTVQLAPIEGTHSVTLNGDKSEYQLTYTIAPAP